VKKILPLAPLLAAASLLSCQGSGNVSTAQFRAAAPTLEMLAVSQNDGDVAEAVASLDAPMPVNSLARPDCHPHLFVRTHEIIGRVNRHFFKLLHHVEELIEDTPIGDGETKTWENVRGGLDRKLTITRTLNPDGSNTFAFELDLAKVPSTTTTPTFVKVLFGSLTHVGPLAVDADAGTSADAGGETLVEDKGTATFDFDALASVSPRERARGQITDAFDNVKDPVNGIKRSATVTLTNFVPEEGDPHGPRSGSYSWLREPGIGGKFVFQDTLVLFCLRNPDHSQSDTTTVARWFKATDGNVHGRSDAKATGGQLPTGDVWMGVTCAKGPTSTEPPEGFWMMKLEDSTGATLSAQLSQVGTEPCDPVWGPVPKVTDNSTDYDFSAPVTFPGEW